MEKKIVNRDDCNLVLKKCVIGGTFDIVNFNVKPFEDKEREYYKPDSILEVSAKISRNISRFRFFLKKFSTKYPAKNELLTAVKASEREIYFYEYFLPNLVKAIQDYEVNFVPHYLLGKVNNVIIMEDLSLRLFVVAKKVNPHLLDRFHISLALKVIAKLHAGSLCYEEIKVKNVKATSLLEQYHVLSQEPLWRKEDNFLGYKVLESGIKGIKSLLAQLQHLEKLDDSLSLKIDALVDKCLEIIKPQTTYRNVVCHGDLQTKNLLFKYEKTSPVDCALLNFGFCRYFLPAYDVLTLIFSTTSKLFRQHYFTYLIEYYHDCLHNELMRHGLHIDQVLPFDEFKQSVNYLMPLIKLKTVLHLQETGAKDGFYKIIEKDDTTYRYFLFEDKSVFLSEVIKKDPIFKLMMIESLEELLDVLNDPRISRETCYEILEKRLDTTVYDLNEFYVTPSENGNLELTMTVGVDNKEGTVSEYKYLFTYGENHSITVLNQIQ